MARGDPTLTNLGSFNVSGAALKTKIDAMADFHPLASGSSIHIIPTGVRGEVQLYRVDIEGAG